MSTSTSTLRTNPSITARPNPNFKANIKTVARESTSKDEGMALDAEGTLTKDLFKLSAAPSINSSTSNEHSAISTPTPSVNSGNGEVKEEVQKTVAVDHSKPILMESDHEILFSPYGASGVTAMALTISQQKPEMSNEEIKNELKHLATVDHSNPLLMEPYQQYISDWFGAGAAAARVSGGNSE
jgi:hypothetical protein